MPFNQTQDFSQAFQEKKNALRKKGQLLNCPYVC